MDGTVFAWYGGFSFALPCIWFIFIFLSIFAHPVVLEKGPLNGCVCVCVTILWLSYDNANVTIDLRWTYNLPNILQRMQG